MSGTDDSRACAEPDEQIVARVLRGDVEPFSVLVSRYQRPVLALGLRFFRSREDAEDFVQEVFLQAYRKLNTFKQTGRFYSWLMRIAYNRGSRTLRRCRDFESIGEFSPPDGDLTPDAMLERREARDAVVSAIRKLPERFADCIGLYYFFELSYKEVSEVTGFALNTVRSHIRRAKFLLARELQDHAVYPAGPGGTYDMP
ncbi:MAG: RNA polymerase sigma factor [Spirochaetota bacterium]